MNRVVATVVVASLALSAPAPAPSAEREAQEGERLLRKASYRSAKPRLDASLELAQRRHDLTGQIRARRLLGQWLDAMGDREGGARELARALDLSRRSVDRRSEGDVLRDTGFVAWRRAEYDAAVRLANEALPIQRAVPDRAGEGGSLDLLARVDLKTGRIESATDGFARAVELRGGAGDLPGELESRIGLVSAHLERRDFRRAMEEAEAIVRRGRESADRDVEVEGMCQTAIVWLFQSAPDAAREALERARARATDPPDPALLARIAHLAAGERRRRGDHAGAVTAYDEAIAAYETLGNPGETAWSLARRSRSLAALGRPPEAEASLRRALEIWRRLGERRPEAYWTYEHGLLLARTGRGDEAWRTWEEALRKEAEIGLPYAPLVLVEMGAIEAGRGACDAGRARVAEAIRASERTEVAEMTTIALYRSAEIERRCARPEEALALLRRCLAVIEERRRLVVPTDEALVGFLEDKQAVFAETVDLLMELGRPREALEVAERARARAFLDLLQGRSDPLATTATPDHPAIADATVVAYFVGAARSFAWIVEPSGRTYAATIPASAGELTGTIAALRDASADPRPSLRELHSTLWSPLERYLPVDPEHRVTIVPHGPLLTLPFGALIDGDGAYLVERHTLDYAPSLRVLRALASDRGPDSGAAAGCLALANPTPARRANGPPYPPLPGAESEAAAAAAAIAEGPKDVLVGGAATEAAFRSLASGRALIHLATHGSIRDDDPLASALLLAASPGGGDGADGTLSAREILDLPLSACLVVLSACDTGRGRVTGEGLLGLSRSFLHAGARSVVVSLWRVSDVASSFLMGRFYAELRAGRSRSAALRRAQLDTIAALRRGEIRAPSGRAVEESAALWGPFILVGDGSGGTP